MTPAEDLAVVRARLERMVELALLDQAYRARIGVTWESDYVHAKADDEERFIAAASPDLLLRVAREALGVLDRHRPGTVGWCTTPREVDCPEVAAVLRAWQSAVT